jgi:8-oxo-dGTP diphosphatase
MKKPLVGIGVIIIHNGKILLGKRKNSHGKGTWSICGGHLEFGESFEECARREALEETGLIISDIIQGPTLNTFFKEEDKHSISIFMIAQRFKGTLINREPDKCEGWEWFSLDSLPQPLFLPIVNLLKTGFLLSALSN